MNMKRFIILFIMAIISISVSSQTEDELRAYFNNNSSNLDPIEGFYDVETSGDYISPLVHLKYQKEQFSWIIKQSFANTFDVYIKYDDGEIGLFDVVKIKKIGTTNVYYFYFESSKCRTYLTDNNYHFVAKLLLDHKTAIKFTRNERLAPSIKIYYNFDCIKTFPNY